MNTKSFRLNVPLLALVLFLCMACNKKNPPDTMNGMDVTYNGRNAFRIHISLADSLGQDVSSDGKLLVTVLRRDIDGFLSAGSFKNF